MTQWLCRYEYRLPEALRQRYRMGVRSYNSVWRKQVYNHQYEDIDTTFNETAQ